MPDALTQFLSYFKFYGYALLVCWALVLLFWAGVWLIGGGRR